MNKDFIQINDYTNNGNTEVSLLGQTIKEINEFREIVKTYSSISVYDDDNWIIDKKYLDRNSSKHEINIVFKYLENNKYKDDIKMFAIHAITANYSIGYIIHIVYRLVKFFNFVFDYNKNLKVENLDYKFWRMYYDNLKNREIKENTKKIYWNDLIFFFRVMEYHEQLRLVLSFDDFIYEKVLNKEKYIPDKVAQELDIIFYKEDYIPIYYKTIYWTLRLIPSRISEVFSMTIGCLKPYIKNNNFIVFIPNFKQSGQNSKGETRKILIQYEGMGKFYIDLLNKQIEISKDLQKFMHGNNKNFLFTSNVYNYIKSLNTFQKIDRIYVFRYIGTFNRLINNLCKVNRIFDDEGNVFHLSSHMFRHNGISDRINSGVFRPIDVMGLTNHKNTAMIYNSYLHPDVNGITDKAFLTHNETGKEVYCRGRILNSNDDLRWKMIIKKPYAHNLIGLGICSDISNCENNLFQCLNCKSFIPSADYLEDFEEQIKEWSIKADIANKNGNANLLELALFNKELNRKIVERIKCAIRSQEIIENAKG